MNIMERLDKQQATQSNSKQNYETDTQIDQISTSLESRLNTSSGFLSRSDSKKLSHRL